MWSLDCRGCAVAIQYRLVLFCLVVMLLVLVLCLMLLHTIAKLRQEETHVKQLFTCPPSMTPKKRVRSLHNQVLRHIIRFLLKMISSMPSSWSKSNSASKSSHHGKKRETSSRTLLRHHTNKKGNIRSRPSRLKQGPSVQT